MLDRLYQRIYLSPHLDDAALSCGGLIYQERKAGLPVLVVTLLAGDAPPDTSSPIVDELHSRWEFDVNPNPVAARRAEDRVALSLLDTDFLHWEWPECIYRRDPRTSAFLYPSETSLWGSPHPADLDLVRRLARHLTNLPLRQGGRVYAPLTVGGHVDHLLVRQAVETWGAPEGVLVYYEDYPYAERTDALEAVLKDGYQWQSDLVHLDEETLAAKSSAIACYHSQISSFFSDREEIDARLRAYATGIAQGQGWAERYWRRD